VVYGDRGPDEAPLVAYTYNGGGNVDEKAGRKRGRKEAYIDRCQPTFTDSVAACVCTLSPVTGLSSK